MPFSGLGDPSSMRVRHPNPFPPSRKGPGIPCSTPCLAKGISAPVSQSPRWPRCISMVPESHPWAGAGTRRQKKSHGVGWVGGESRWYRQEEEDLSCTASWPLAGQVHPGGCRAGAAFPRHCHPAGSGCSWCSAVTPSPVSPPARALGTVSLPRSTISRLLFLALCYLIVIFFSYREAKRGSLLPSVPCSHLTHLVGPSGPRSGKAD